MGNIHVDCETYSPAKLKTVGSYRYAADPATELLMVACAMEDGPVRVWVPEQWESDHVQSDSEVFDLFAQFSNPRNTLWAHNSQFEHAVFEKHFEKQTCFQPPELEMWRCTSAMGRCAGLAADLATLAQQLRLEHLKDKRGAALIRKFSVPDKRKGRTLPSEDPEAFAEFVEYCRQDVRVERDVYRKLKAFQLTGDNLKSFLADARLNARGVPVNVQALRHAQKLLKAAEEELVFEFEVLTDYLPTQRDRALEWLQERGYPYGDLQAGTIQKALEEPLWEDYPDVRRALEIRAMVSYSATKKIASMLACECGDGHVRGCHLWYGAHTGRHAGRHIQPQNFKRPSPEIDTVAAYGAILQGEGLDAIRRLGPPIETIASSVRHFVHPPHGILDCDYSNLESRILCWLAEQDDALKAYLLGEDQYVRMASVIFGKSEAEIDSYERFVGKTAVLGCGYGMGPDRFAGTCETYGQVVAPELAKRAVEAFRKRYREVVRLWYAVKDAAVKALTEQGKTCRVNSLLSFRTVQAAGMLFLVMTLPSGRNVVYPAPKLETGQYGPEVTYHGLNSYSRKWERLRTYGAKLVENAVQGIAEDILTHGVACAEAAGYSVFMVVHDQALAHHARHPEAFFKAMNTLPRWAAGLPLAVEGKVTQYYMK